MTNTDWGLRPPTDTDVFYQHPERGSPPSVLYQRIYPPAGSSAEEWGALSRGQGVPQGGCNLKLVCLLGYPMKSD